MLHWTICLRRKQNNMFLKQFPLVFVLLSSVALQAQTDVDTKNFVDDLNRRIDRAVVSRDFVLLSQWYSDDFVFTHGTGVVDSKESWLKDLRTRSAKFLSREHDSINVELHNDIAIVTGTLTVRKEADDPKKASYGVRYVRVYAKRKKMWQLISHRTVKEWYNPPL